MSSLFVSCQFSHLSRNKRAAECRFVKDKVLRTIGKEKPHLFMTTAFNPNRRQYFDLRAKTRSEATAAALELLALKPGRPRPRDESHKCRPKRDICGHVADLQGLGPFGVANFWRLWSSALGYPASLDRLWTATGPGSRLGVNLLCGFPSVFSIALQDFVVGRCSDLAAACRKLYSAHQCPLLFCAVVCVVSGPPCPVVESQGTFKGAMPVQDLYSERVMELRQEMLDILTELENGDDSELMLQAKASKLSCSCMFLPGSCVRNVCVLVCYALPVSLQTLQGASAHIVRDFGG